MIQPDIDCVFIETTTACTRKCVWCTHHYYDIKPDFMAEELFLKIVSELGDAGFSGRLSYYLNGEPLLDKRLAGWIGIGKERCPQAFSFIISNGDLATYDRIVELFDSGLDALKINTYDDRTLRSVNDVLKKLPPALSKRILHIDSSKKTDWTSRGGTVPFGNTAKNQTPDKTVCLRPFRQMYITSSGLVAQCCSDALNKYIMGDMNTQSFMEIWHGEPFAKVRDSLLNKGELNDLCKACNLERYYDSADHLRNLFGLNANAVQQP